MFQRQTEVRLKKNFNLNFGGEHFRCQMLTALKVYIKLSCDPHGLNCDVNLDSLMVLTPCKEHDFSLGLTTEKHISWFLNFRIWIIMLASNKLGVPPFNFANFNLKVMSEDKHEQAEKQFVYSVSFVIMIFIFLHTILSL